MPNLDPCAFDLDQSFCTTHHSEDYCKLESLCDKIDVRRQYLHSSVSDVDALDNSQLDRILTVPVGAEVTGLELINGELFYNAQHPDESNGVRAGLGIAYNYNWNEFPRGPEAVNVPPQSGGSYNVAYGKYKTLARAGDILPGSGHVLGEIMTGPNSSFISNDPDFNGFVRTNEEGTEGYLYTSWENVPSGISRLRIQKDLVSGEWNLISGEMLDTSSVNGVWILCFGTVTPWNTPLHSEEAFDAESTENWIATRGEPGSRYEGLKNQIGKLPDPYDYGYIVEIERADQESSHQISKRTTMGRMAHENSEVMADRKTVYLSDDGSYKAMYKYVADVAGDLSAGTLYAAKVKQDQTRNNAEAGFDVEWIRLGSATEEQVATWKADYADTDRYITDSEIAAQALGVNAPYQDDRVAFLETGKFAKALGASNEFNKMEGTRYNRAHPNFIYMAMSTVGNGMSDLEGDIQVTENPCGVVYALHLSEDFNVDRMDPIAAGKPYVNENGKTKCDEGYISNPDNILVLDDGRVIIGEDTSKHTNNMAWIWQGGYIEPLKKDIVNDTQQDQDSGNPLVNVTPEEESKSTISSILGSITSLFSGSLQFKNMIFNLNK